MNQAKARHMLIFLTTLSVIQIQRMWHVLMDLVSASHEVQSSLQPTSGQRWKFTSKWMMLVHPMANLKCGKMTRFSLMLPMSSTEPLINLVSAALCSAPFSAVEARNMHHLLILLRITKISNSVLANDSSKHISLFHHVYVFMHKKWLYARWNMWMICFYAVHDSLYGFQLFPKAKYCACARLCADS